MKRIEVLGDCEICGGVAEHYDHDHNTGLVRGILCPQCNFGIGNFRDRLDLLAKAAVYLTKPPTNVLYADVKRAEMRRWGERNPQRKKEISREWARKYRAAHREEHNAYVREWRDKKRGKPARPYKRKAA